MSNNELQQHHSSSDSKALSDDDLLLVSGGWGQQKSVIDRKQEMNEKHGYGAQTEYGKRGTERHGFLWLKESPTQVITTTHPDGFVQRTTTRVEVR